MQTSKTQLPFGANITNGTEADYYLGGTDSNGRKSGFGELFYASNVTKYQGTVLVLTLLRKCIIHLFCALEKKVHPLGNRNDHSVHDLDVGCFSSYLIKGSL